MNSRHHAEQCMAIACWIGLALIAACAALQRCGKGIR